MMYMMVKSPPTSSHISTWSTAACWASRPATRRRRLEKRDRYPKMLGKIWKSYGNPMKIPESYEIMMEILWRSYVSVADLVGMRGISWISCGKRLRKLGMLGGELKEFREKYWISKANIDKMKWIDETNIWSCRRRHSSSNYWAVEGSW